MAAAGKLAADKVVAAGMVAVDKVVAEDTVAVAGTGLAADMVAVEGEEEGHSVEEVAGAAQLRVAERVQRRRTKCLPIRPPLTREPFLEQHSTGEFA